MAIICGHCGAENNPCPDFSLYHIEGRSYRYKPSMTPQGIQNLKTGIARQLELTEYILQECSSCHQLMLTDEYTRTAFYSPDEEDKS